MESAGGVIHEGGTEELHYENPLILRLSRYHEGDQHQNNLNIELLIIKSYMKIDLIKVIGRDFESARLQDKVVPSNVMKFHFFHMFCIYVLHLKLIAGILDT